MSDAIRETIHAWLEASKNGHSRTLAGMLDGDEQGGTCRPLRLRKSEPGRWSGCLR